MTQPESTLNVRSEKFAFTRRRCREECFRAFSRHSHFIRAPPGTYTYCLPACAVAVVGENSRPPINTIAGPPSPGIIVPVYLYESRWRPYIITYPGVFGCVNGDEEEFNIQSDRHTCTVGTPSTLPVERVL